MKQSEKTKELIVNKMYDRLGLINDQTDVYHKICAYGLESDSQSESFYALEMINLVKSIKV